MASVDCKSLDWFVGRKAKLHDLRKSLGLRSKGTFITEGRPGIGKTWVLKKLFCELSNTMPPTNRPVLVFHRFLPFQTQNLDTLARNLIDGAEGIAGAFQTAGIKRRRSYEQILREINKKLAAMEKVSEDLGHLIPQAKPVPLVIKALRTTAGVLTAEEKRAVSIERSLRDALAEAGRACDARGCKLIIFIDDFQYSEDSVAKCLATVIEEMPKNVFFIIGIRTGEQHYDLLLRIASQPDPPCEPPLVLEELDENDALEYLELRLRGNPGLLEQLEDIYDKTGGYPIYLNAAVELLLQGWDISNLGGRLEIANLHKALFESMTEDEQEILTLLVVMHRLALHEDATTDLLADMLNYDSMHVKQILKSRALNRWLDGNDNIGYRCYHELFEEYVISEVLTEDATRTIHRRIGCYYLKLPLTTRENRIRRLRYSIPYLHAAEKYRLVLETVTEAFLEECLRLFGEEGFDDEIEEILELAVGAARLLQDRKRESQLLVQLSQIRLFGTEELREYPVYDNDENDFVILPFDIGSVRISLKEALTGTSQASEIRGQCLELLGYAFVGNRSDTHLDADIQVAKGYFEAAREEYVEQQKCAAATRCEICLTWCDYICNKLDSATHHLDETLQQQKSLTSFCGECIDHLLFAGRLYSCAKQWEQAAELYAQVSQCLPRSQYERAADLLCQSASWWKRAGKRDRAEELYETAVSLLLKYAKICTVDLEDRARLFHRVAEIYERTSQRDGNTDYFTKAATAYLSASEQVRLHTVEPTALPLFLDTSLLVKKASFVAHAADCYSKAGRVLESADLYAKTVSILKENEEQEKAAELLEQLAEMQISHGVEGSEVAKRFEEAGDMYVQVEEWAEAASCYCTAGKIREAYGESVDSKKAFKHSLHAYEKAIEETCSEVDDIWLLEYPWLIQRQDLYKLMMDASRVYDKAGQVNAKKRSLETVVEWYARIAEQEQDSEDFDVLRTRAGLYQDVAYLCSCFGLPDAKRFSEEALILYKRSLSVIVNETNDHLRARANCYLNRGVLLSSIGSCDEAIHECQNAVEELGKMRPTDYEAVGEAYQDLGDLHFRKDEYSEAKSAYEKATVAFETSVRWDPVRIVQCHIAIGACFSARREYDSSIASFRQALEICESLDAAKRKDLAWCYYGIAEVLHRKGAPQEAEREYNKAIEAVKGADEVDHETLAQCYGGLADCVADRGEFGDAISLYSKAQSEYKLVQPQDDESIAFANYSIGYYTALSGNLKQAVEILSEVSQQFESLGKRVDSADSLECASLYALMLAEEGRALKLAKAAVEEYARNGESTSASFREAQAILALLEKRQSEAVAWLEDLPPDDDPDWSKGDTEWLRGKILQEMKQPREAREAHRLAIKYWADQNRAAFLAEIAFRGADSIQEADS